MAELLFAGTVGEFDEDTRVIVGEGAREIGVFRVGDEFYAFRNRCLHQGGPVCEGLVIGKVESVLDEEKRELGRTFSTERVHIVCPWHAWEFDIETGECAGDRTLQLRRFPVRVEGDEVYVEV